MGWKGGGVPKKNVARKPLLGSTSISIPKKFSVSKNMLAKGGSGPFCSVVSEGIKKLIVPVGGGGGGGGGGLVRK